MATNAIEYQLRLDTGNFSSALQHVLAGMNSMKQNLLAVAGAAFGLRAAFGQISSAAAAMQAAMQTSSQLLALARRTGETVGNLVILRRAFEDAGLGAESVGFALNMMQRALAGVNEEGQPTNAAFARLGLNLETLRRLTPTEQLLAVGRAIAAIPDPATRAATAMQIFGRSGAQFLAVLGDTAAIDNARESAGAMAIVYERAAQSLDRAGNALSAMRQALQTVWAALAEPIAPIWEELARGVRQFADELMNSGATWRAALTEIVGLFKVVAHGVTALGRAATENAGALLAVAKAALAFGSALAALKLAALLASLGQKTIALAQSTAAWLAETNAIRGNTAELLRNAAARAAGMPAAVPRPAAPGGPAGVGGMAAPRPTLRYSPPRWLPRNSLARPRVWKRSQPP